MALFFSKEWVAEVDAAIQASEEVARAAVGKNIVFEQTATDSPHGEAAYHIVIADGAVRAVSGRAENPTISITGPWDVHVSINKGEISPPVALLTGKGKLSGDRMKLISERNLFATIHAGTIAVRTEY
ncbi:SCP2 sterol-binding domain-containing protein [Sphaerimonospora sp. CA-214678]|uniref:SCP2 sterol-binding domain-containing protein n=1 Tax=Sphaerimonospora sp. CA-214678 TaxID=3240029 RepID=UPI003D8E9B69